MDEKNCYLINGEGSGVDQHSTSIYYVHHRYEWSYLLLGALVDNKNKIRNEWRVPASPRPVRADR